MRYVLIGAHGRELASASYLDNIPQWATVVAQLKAHGRMLVDNRTEERVVLVDTSQAQTCAPSGVPVWGYAHGKKEAHVHR